MPVMRKPIGSKDVFGDNFLTRMFPGDTVNPADAMNPLGMAVEGAAGPLQKLIWKLQSMMGRDAKVPTNLGDALLRDHTVTNKLDSRISGIEPPARTGLTGAKTSQQAKDDAYERMMDNGSQRTTPELRKPTGEEPAPGDLQRFLDVLRNRKQGQ